MKDYSNGVIDSKGNITWKYPCKGIDFKEERLKAKTAHEKSWKDFKKLLKKTNR